MFVSHKPDNQGHLFPFLRRRTWRFDALSWLQPSERTSHFLSVDVQGYQSIRLRNFPVGHNSLAIFWILDKSIIIYTLNYKPFEFSFLNCQATIMQSMLHAITNPAFISWSGKEKTENWIPATLHTSPSQCLCPFCPPRFFKTSIPPLLLRRDAFLLEGRYHTSILMEKHWRPLHTPNTNNLN